jgi:hypothetical protein
MKNLFIFLLLVAVAFFVYKAYTSGVLQKKTRLEAGPMVQGVVRSGKDVGHGAEKAFRGVNFGRR